MARDQGRPCGCDPAANHPCEGHAGFVKEQPATFNAMNRDAVVVDGPDKIGLFTIGTFRCGQGNLLVKVERFVVEDIIEELQARLKERV